eukprot:COSAG01_NODE_20221_length_964_cov_46.717919_2_plen_78_part_01
MLCGSSLLHLHRAQRGLEVLCRTSGKTSGWTDKREEWARTGDLLVGARALTLEPAAGEVVVHTPPPLTSIGSHTRMAT